MVAGSANRRRLEAAAVSATVKITTTVLTVTVSGTLGNARDWVGLFRPGSDNAPAFDWKYLANNRQTPRPLVGVTSGTVTLNISGANISGLYEIRVLSAQNLTDYAVIAVSAPFNFGPWPVSVNIMEAA